MSIFFGDYARGRQTPCLGQPGPGLFYIVLLSILSIGIALLTLASSLRDAEAINVVGSLRMQSYRLGYDLQSGSSQLNAHRQLFQQALNSPALSNLNAWYVPQTVKSRYGQLHANWLEMNTRLVDADIKWYRANINNYVDQIDLFVLALQHYAERKVMLVVGISLAGGIGIFTLVFFTLRRIRQQVVQPLNQLVAASQHIEHGQFDIPPLNTHLPNELGLLAKTFSQMSSELHKLYRSLEASVEEKPTICTKPTAVWKCCTSAHRRSIPAKSTFTVSAIFYRSSANMTPLTIWN